MKRPNTLKATKNKIYKLWANFKDKCIVNVSANMQVSDRKNNAEIGVTGPQPCITFRN